LVHYPGLAQPASTVFSRSAENCGLPGRGKLSRERAELWLGFEPRLLVDHSRKPHDQGDEPPVLARVQRYGKDERGGHSMTVTVHSYTIYHSPNAYLGTVLLRRTIADLPDVELVRRPIYIPRERGVMIAELLGGKENRNVGSYLREDCRRWAERFTIPFSYPGPEIFHQRAERWAVSAFHREELPARAFYAADAEKRDVFDRALFDAAWVEGLDVNEPETIRWAAQRAGIDPHSLMMTLAEPGPGGEARNALEEFERLQCPGVPTVVVNGQRYFGKDRVDWAIDACRTG